MKRVIKNNYKIIIGILIGITLSATTVYAIEAYIESSKVSYDNHNEKTTTKDNVQDSIDELYERSGLHKEKWVDPELNGADPVLKDPLIPVEIKNDGTVYYANENSEWYNYSEKRWANAVILIDNPSNQNYKVGDHILEEDIKGYFVWIPRYSYKIWNLGKYTTTMTLKDLTNEQTTTTAETSLWRIAGNNSRIIDVKFGTANDIPKMAEPTSTDVYYTHPAFTLGNKDLNGIWVGKFETGGSANNVVVKPKVSSWRNESIKEFFNAGKNFATTLDSHMMKNTEWGAVAYLSHSQYGIGTEVNINNTEDYYTGYSASSNTDQTTYPSDSAAHDVKEKTQPWNTVIGYLASTTGNISGIYDMSGCAWEYVAAYKQNSTSTDQSGFSETEITTQIANGYIDEYSGQNFSSTSYNRRILGDATGEMGLFYAYYENNGVVYQHSSWYSDNAFFIDSTNPWFFRGGYYYDGVVAGLFYFNGGKGSPSGGGSFRIALSPINT